MPGKLHHVFSFTLFNLVVVVLVGIFDEVRLVRTLSSWTTFDINSVVIGTDVAVFMSQYRRMVKYSSCYISTIDHFKKMIRNWYNLSRRHRRKSIYSTVLLLARICSFVFGLHFSFRIENFHNLWFFVCKVYPLPNVKYF